MSSTSAVEPAALQLFDRDFYLSLYRSEIPEGRDATEHFFDEGWQKGRNPSRQFDTVWYLLANADVRASGVCPLIHYALHGAIEGRLPRAHPDDSMSRPSLLKAAFDADYYINAYPDIARANVAPLLHYLEFGWREGRNPSSDFDTQFYLETNPDVAALDECPFIHFVSEGRQEGRPGRRLVSPQRAAINSAIDPRDQVQLWLRPPPTVTHGKDVILDRLNQSLAEQPNGLILSASHDDYAEIFGGVQNCVGDEQRVFSARGWNYLHIHPTQPLPLLSDVQSSDEFFVQIRLNGVSLGAAALSELTDALDQHKHNYSAFHVVIHHLLGFSPELFLAAFRRLQPLSVVAWLHDYFTLCANPPLLRNNVKFCDAPPLTSQTCALCCYGQQRQTHLLRIQAFLDELKPDILAPSQTALDFWRSRIGRSYDHSKIIPHGTMREGLPVTRRGGAPLRIAFVGAAVYHKGWFTFEELASRHLGDRRYAFFHLGSARSHFTRNIAHIKAAVSSDSRNAMAKAIADAEIDAVVQWSLCYETFSFTSYEALAGGAFVITRKDAGNVWPAVRSTAEHQGIALDDEEALYALFAGSGLPDLLTERSFFDFTHSGVTAEHLLAPSHV